MPTYHIAVHVLTLVLDSILSNHFIFHLIMHITCLHKCSYMYSELNTLSSCINKLLTAIIMYFWTDEQSSQGVTA